MRFFNRNKTNTAAIPEDLQPYYTNQNSGMGRWVMPIVRGALLLALLGVLVWGGLSLVHRLTDKNSGDTSASAQSSQNSSSTAKSDKSDTSNSATSKPESKQDKAGTGTSSTSTTSPSTAAPTPSPVAATPTAPDPTATAPAPSPTPATTTTTPAVDGETLVNTGPGSVAALFAVATLAGAFLYRLFLTRSLNRG